MSPLRTTHSTIDTIWMKTPKSRYLLIKPMEKLTGDEASRLVLVFEIAPKLTDAYCVKNESLTVIHAKSSAEGKPRLVNWLQSVEMIDLPEFKDCTKACRNY